MRTAICLLFSIFLAGCNGIAKRSAAKESPALQIGISSVQDVENRKGKPHSYEGEAAEFGTIIWVYPDVRFHFKRGILEKVEETGHNNHMEGIRE